MYMYCTDMCFFGTMWFGQTRAIFGVGRCCSGRCNLEKSKHETKCHLRIMTRSNQRSGNNSTEWKSTIFPPELTVSSNASTTWRHSRKAHSDLSASNWWSSFPSVIDGQPPILLESWTRIWYWWIFHRSKRDYVAFFEVWFKLEPGIEPEPGFHRS
jgi:hypothetical protein